MEGDAKGQVGGMEMPETERKRLAEESRSWKCHGCGGRSNETILKEEGGIQVDGAAAAAKAEQQIVPEELKLGFMDEMLEQKKKKKTPDAAASLTESSPSHSSHQDITETLAPVGPPSTAAGTGPVAPAVPSEQSQSNVQAHQPEPLPQRVPTGSNGPPVWIDKAIAGVAAALAVMVVKKLVI